jgi:isoleucyl-tRNA synthetase
VVSPEEILGPQRKIVNHLFMQFPKVNPKQSFPQLEEAVLAYWEKEKIFEETLERKASEGDFAFYDGPPFATGLPHYGHILQGVIKDLIPRYKTMKGFRVPRKWGWDCHGLPVENLIEKELGLKNREEIVDFGIGKFNEACRSSVLRYASEWKKTVKRMGRWIDMENDYKTMDVEFMNSVWWVFHELWEKGLIYEGLKPMHICPRCETPLSNFEVGLGYKDTTDLTAIAKFELEDEANTFVLAWTTTPWTLPGNVALAVNPSLEYTKVRKKDTGEIFWLAKKSIERIFGEKPVIRYEYKDGSWDLTPGSDTKNPPASISEGNIEVIKNVEGIEFINIVKKYKPLFPYFEEEKKNGGFRIIKGDFVSADEGTGIVHIAPAFGDDDYNLSKVENLPVIQHVGMDGKFTAEVKDFAGEEVKPIEDPRKIDTKIIKWLEEKGKLFASDKVKHSYPFCWRCESPLLNYATSSWFVNVEKIKKDLLKNNQEINWVPEHIKGGRFGKWLEGARDWAISRNRFWGAPLPVWRCDCGETKCISSREELEKLSGKKVTDLHKHFVDEITFPCSKCKDEMKRIPEVLDCWFESGSMPYAQNATKAETKLPADFIAEAQDQTRGWFYTLHVLATALQNKPAFANCICSGLVLAEDGQKMSKSKKNFPPPENIFEKYGADAMRLYLMNSPVVNAQELRFSERGVEETLRSVLLPLWNTYYFFTTYASADGWEGGELPAKPSNKLDRWILSELNLLTKEMSEKLEAYEIQAALKPLAAFLDGLTNWYIRRSRRRFWRKAPSKIEGKSENDGDKEEAYATLLHVLKEVSKLLAPVAPFLAEEIYRGLTGEKSVHLAAWPEVDAKRIDEALSKEVEVTRKIISLGLAIRGREKIKVRLPLAKTIVALPGKVKLEMETIQEELNVKEIEIAKKPEEIATLIVEVNARFAGKRLGGKVQEIIKLSKEGKFEIVKEGVKIGDEILTGEEVKVGYKGREGEAVESDSGIVVSLDTKITPELELEGKARDLVRVIQDLRKQADYAVSDRIELQLENAEAILAVWQDYIAAETLATKVVNKVEKADAEDSLEGVKIGVRKN